MKLPTNTQTSPELLAIAQNKWESCSNFARPDIDPLFRCVSSNRRFESFDFGPEVLRRTCWIARKWNKSDHTTGESSRFLGWISLCQAKLDPADQLPGLERKHETFSRISSATLGSEWFSRPISVPPVRRKSCWLQPRIFLSPSLSLFLS